MDDGICPICGINLITDLTDFLRTFPVNRQIGLHYRASDAQTLCSISATSMSASKSEDGVKPNTSSL